MEVSIRNYKTEIKSISTPISIPRSPNSHEYSLKESAFNPSKNSPPNSWSKRLLNRFDNYYGY
jgi:hypothetical protein